MAGNLGEAVLELSASFGSLKGDLAKAEREVQRVGRQIEGDFKDSGQKAGDQFGKGFAGRVKAGKAKFTNALKGFGDSKIGQSIGIGIGSRITEGILGQVGRIRNFIGDAISVGADFEQVSVGFEVLIGDAGKAKKALKELSDFAATTPFELPEVQSAGRALLAFGVSTDKLKGSLKAIGDVSAGIGAPIGEIAEIYGKARTQGRLFGEDINQLTGRGIPIIQELAKQFGVAEDEVKKLVSEGSVNFGHLERAFQDLTNEGGKFNNLMERQSQTTGGALSNLSDQITQVKISLFQAFSPALNAVIARTAQVINDVVLFAQDLAARFQALPNSMQDLITNGGLLTAGFTALLAVVGGLVAVLSGGMIAAFVSGVAAAAPFIAAVVAIGAAITALVVGVRNLIGWWDGMSAAQREATRESEPLQYAIGQTIELVRALGRWLVDQIPTVIKWGEELVRVVIFFAEKWKENFDATIDVINFFLVGLREGYSGVVEFKDKTIAAVTAVKTQGSDLINQFKDAIAAAIATVREIIQTVIAKFEEFKAAIAEAIGPQGVAILKTFERVALGVFKALVKPITNMIDLAKKAKDALSSLSNISIPNPFDRGGGGGTATGGGSGKASNVLGYRVTSPFGPRRGRLHAGTDFGTPVGTPIYAPTAGKVSYAQNIGAGGNAVALNQIDGMITKWMHLSRFAVKSGENVKAGQLLGYTGNTGRSTGPHLHLEAYRNGRAISTPELIKYLKSTRGIGGESLPEHLDTPDDDHEHHDHEHDHDHEHHGEVELKPASSGATNASLGSLSGLDIMQAQIEGLQQFGEAGRLSGANAEGLGLASAEQRAESLTQVYEQMSTQIQKVIAQARGLDTSAFNFAELLEYQQGLAQLVTLNQQVQPGEQLSDIQAAATAAQREADLEKLTVQNDLAEGLIEEDAVAGKLQQTYASLSESMNALIPRIQTFILTASDPSAVANAKAYLQEIRDTVIETKAAEKAAQDVKKETSQYVGILQSELSSQAGSLFRTLLTDIKSADDAVGNFFDNLFNRIFDQALQNGINAIFGAIGGGGGGFGGIVSSIFGAKQGGIIPNFKSGGIVGFVEAAGEALRKEGPGGRLIAAQTGERVLTRRETAVYDRMMRMSMIPAYATGGVVGRNTALPAAMSGAQQKSRLQTEIINRREYVDMETLRTALSQTHEITLQTAARDRASDMRNSNYRKQNRLR